MRTTYEGFRARSHLRSLDGLRAVSVILVLFAHSQDELWEPLHGTHGVALFFLISGLLITTLLLREEDADGSVSLSAFWIRRTFRIVPLYLLALTIFTVTRLGLGFGEGTDDYAHRLLYFVTFTNELSGDGTFGHSWSLGVEEKFYLVWPLLAFGVAAFSRHRASLIAALTVASLISWLAAPESYLALYTPIFLGCGLALVLHDPRGFAILARLAGPLAGAATLAATVAALLIFQPPGNVFVPFALVAMWAFPTLLLADGPVQHGLASRFAVLVGRRSYAIYLFHPLVAEVVDRAVDPHQGTGPALVRFALLFGGSLAFAELLYRFVERPLIDIGRGLAARRQERSKAANAISLPT